jgi:hypothetical protein
MRTDGRYTVRRGLDNLDQPRLFARNFRKNGFAGERIRDEDAGVAVARNSFAAMAEACDGQMCHARLLSEIRAASRFFSVRSRARGAVATSVHSDMLRRGLPQ